MTLSSVATLLADVYQKQQLPMPAIVFPIIALCVFTLLGFVAWSYRDVANRHAGKAPHGGDHHGPTV